MSRSKVIYHTHHTGANIPLGKDVPVEPQFTKVTWKATRLVEKRTKWALIWAKNHGVEALFTPQGGFTWICAKTHDSHVTILI